MYHERAFLQSNIDFVKVKCVVELQGLEHAKKIDKILVDNGFEPVWAGDWQSCYVKESHNESAI